MDRVPDAHATNAEAQRAAIAVLSAEVRVRLLAWGLPHWSASVTFPPDAVGDVQLRIEHAVDRDAPGRLVLLPRVDVLAFAISERSRDRILRAVEAAALHLNQETTVTQAELARWIERITAARSADELSVLSHELSLRPVTPQTRILQRTIDEVLLQRELDASRKEKRP